MTSGSTLDIEQLSNHHDRQAFASGNSALDGYLKQQAKQDVKRHVCRVFVLTAQGARKDILGFYTLSASSVERTNLPAYLARKLPRHPVPAALLGRLAVNQPSQGSGLGTVLLADAIKRASAAADQIGIYALLVDAIDARAQRFYERFDFAPLQQNERRLFLPLKSVCLAAS